MAPGPALSDLVGEFALLTDLGGGSTFASTLRLAIAPGTDSLRGVEEYPDREGGVLRQPVVLDGDELLIGAHAGGGPARYQIERCGADAFSGTYRLPQPEWLQQQQPGHPAWRVGLFTAQRMRGSV